MFLPSNLSPALPTQLHILFLSFQTKTNKEDQSKQLNKKIKKKSPNKYRVSLGVLNYS